MADDKIDENQVQVDEATGLKKITNVNESKMQVQRKSHIQDNIDKYRVLLQKGMASLELMQMIEQDLKDKIRQRQQQNGEKITAIKTQVYILRNLLTRIDKFINGGETAENLSQS